MWQKKFRVDLPGQKGISWRYVRAKPVKLPNGSVLWQGMVMDVSEREQTEMELRESEERFRKINDLAMDGIVMADGHGNIVTWNQACEKMFGYRAEEVLGKPIHDLLAPEEYREATARGFETFAETGQGPIVGKTHELFGSKKDGSRFPIELSVSSVKFRTGWHAIGIIHDVSRRKLMEEELRAAVEASEAKSKLLEMLMAHMSHDIRTLLSLIVGYVDFVRERLEKSGYLSGEVNGWLDIVRSSVRHMLDLVNDMLEMSKIRAGALELKKEPVLIGKVLREIYQNFSPQASEKNIQYRIEDHTPPGLKILGDGLKIKQVVINLISNAIKYTIADERPEKESAVWLSMGIESIDGQENMVIRVKDTGAGIAEDEIGNLFQNFIRTRSARGQSSRESTGLGLAVSQGLAMAMGGKITVESKVGAGSTFTFIFPATRVERGSEFPEHPNGEGTVAAGEGQDEKSAVPEPTPGESGPIVAHGGHATSLYEKFSPGMTLIFAAEDDVDIGPLLNFKLRGMGFPEIKISTDGKPLIDSLLAAERLPDVILLDSMMPRMSGLQALREIRENPSLDRLRNIPVILFTANSADHEEVVESLRAGAMSFVSKNSESKALLAKIEQAVVAARSKEWQRQDIPAGFAEVVEPFGLHPVEVAAKSLSGKSIPANLASSELLGEFLVGSSIAQAVGSFLYAGGGKEIRSDAKRNAISMADRSLRHYTQRDPSLAVVIIADEGSRDHAVPLQKGSIYFNGVLINYQGWDDLQQAIRDLEAQRVRISYLVNSAVENVNGMAAAEALTRPMNSVSLSGLFDGQENLIYSGFRIGGIGFSAPSDAGVTPFDLPSEALPKIASARGITPGTPEYADFMDHAIIFILDRPYQKNFIDDAMELKKDFPGLKIALPGDGAFVPLVASASGLDLDGRDMFAFGRFGAREAVASRIATFNNPYGQFSHTFVAESTNQRLEEGTAHQFSTDEQEDFRRSGHLNGGVASFRTRLSIQSGGIIAATSTTGASPEIFGKTFSDAFRRITVSDENGNVVAPADYAGLSGKGSIVTNTLFVTRNRGVFVIRTRFEAEDLAKTVQALQAIGEQGGAISGQSSSGRSEVRNSGPGVPSGIEKIFSDEARQAVREMDLATLHVALRMVTGQDQKMDGQEREALEKMQFLLGSRGWEATKSLLTLAETEAIIRERIKIRQTQIEMMREFFFQKARRAIGEMSLSTLQVALYMITDKVPPQHSNREKAALKEMQSLINVGGWDKLKELLIQSKSEPLIRERIRILTDQPTDHSPQTAAKTLSDMPKDGNRSEVRREGAIKYAAIYNGGKVVLLGAAFSAWLAAASLLTAGSTHAAFPSLIPAQKLMLLLPKSSAGVPAEKPSEVTAKTAGQEEQAKEAEAQSKRDAYIELVVVTGFAFLAGAIALFVFADRWIKKIRTNRRFKESIEAARRIDFPDEKLKVYLDLIMDLTRAGREKQAQELNDELNSIKVSSDIRFQAYLTALCNDVRYFGFERTSIGRHWLAEAYKLAEQGEASFDFVALGNLLQRMELFDMEYDLDKLLQKLTERPENDPEVLMSNLAKLMDSSVSRTGRKKILRAAKANKQIMGYWKNRYAEFIGRSSSSDADPLLISLFHAGMFSDESTANDKEFESSEVHGGGGGLGGAGITGSWESDHPTSNDDHGITHDDDWGGDTDAFLPLIIGSGVALAAVLGTAGLAVAGAEGQVPTTSLSAGASFVVLALCVGAGYLFLRLMKSMTVAVFRDRRRTVIRNEVNQKALIIRDGTGEERTKALREVMEWDPELSEVFVPLLINIVEKEMIDEKFERFYFEQAPDATPAVKSTLNSSDFHLNVVALLGDLGWRAKPALPVLRELADTDVISLRSKKLVNLYIGRIEMSIQEYAQGVSREKEPAKRSEIRADQSADPSRPLSPSPVLSPWERDGVRGFQSRESRSEVRGLELMDAPVAKKEFVSSIKTGIPVSGTFIPFHHQRSNDDWGIGDFGTDLEAIELSAALGLHIRQHLPLSWSGAYNSPYSEAIHVLSVSRS